MFGEYGNGFNQYPPMQQQSQYPFIQQKPSQFTPQPQQPVVKPPAMLYTVSNRTEVEAYMVACDGSTTYFLCPAENCIYSKSVDMMGRPVINTFALQNSNPVQTIVTREMFGNRPDYARIQQMVQGKTPEQLSQIVFNMANTYQIPREQVVAMAQQIGLNLK